MSVFGYAAVLLFAPTRRPPLLAQNVHGSLKRTISSPQERSHASAFSPSRYNHHCTPPHHHITPTRPTHLHRRPHVLRLRLRRPGHRRLSHVQGLQAQREVRTLSSTELVHPNLRRPPGARTLQKSAATVTITRGAMSSISRTQRVCAAAVLSRAVVDHANGQPSPILQRLRLL